MKFVLPLAVVAFIVAGFAYYALFSAPAPDVVALQEEVADRPSVVPSGPVESTDRASFAGEGSLFSLLSRGDTLECQITYVPNPAEPEMQGNLFTDESRLRGDFVVPTPDLSGQMVTSMIIADDTIWQWTDVDGEVVGSRQEADFAADVLGRLVVPIGFDAAVQYNCLAWPQVDNTIFEAPGTVDFTDVATATFEEGVIYEEGEF